ncbi:ANTAR domain-containing protein [Mycolicibacterium anyangense]|nr:ANTAR domain-containing protein [Mycolicibacterium anyangense]
MIDQAVGVMRGRTGRSTDEALDQLRSISQSEQRKLAMSLAASSMSR